MNKTKLFLGAVGVVIIAAAPISISVHRNAVRAQDVPQTSQIKPITQAAPTPETSTSPVPAGDVSVETPAAPTPKPTCDQRQDVYCYGVHGRDEYGTPIPEVKTTQPAQPWVRSDGYFNYCYQMPDGSWTTVTGKLDLQKGVYYYGGDIDEATQAPAYAVESQQWCASHVPAEAL